jgi:hypothetical protein
MARSFMHELSPTQNMVLENLSGARGCARSAGNERIPKTEGITAGFQPGNTIAESR